MIERFADAEHGGFFTTAPTGELSCAPQGPRGLTDPLGQLGGRLGLLRLARLSGEASYERHALAALRLLSPIAGRHPLAFGTRCRP